MLALRPAAAELQDMIDIEAAKQTLGLRRREPGQGGLLRERG